MKKVFLGGTCNDSKWREYVIKYLFIDYFNPVVEDWTEEAQEVEEFEKEKADFRLYVITPKMTGVFSIAEVVEDSNKHPDKTLFCVLPEDEEDSFTIGQMKSLNQVGKIVHNNGATVLKDLDEVINYLNYT